MAFSFSPTIIQAEPIQLLAIHQTTAIPIIQAERIIGVTAQALLSTNLDGLRFVPTFKAPPQSAFRHAPRYHSLGIRGAYLPGHGHPRHRSCLGQRCCRFERKHVHMLRPVKPTAWGAPTPLRIGAWRLACNSPHDNNHGRDKYY